MYYNIEDTLNTTLVKHREAIDLAHALINTTVQKTTRIEALTAELSALVGNDNEGQVPTAACSGVSPPDIQDVVAEPRRRGDVKYQDSIFLAALTTKDERLASIQRTMRDRHGVANGTTFNRLHKLADDPSSPVTRGEIGFYLNADEEPVSVQPKVAKGAPKQGRKATKAPPKLVSSTPVKRASIRSRGQQYEVFRTPLSAFTPLLDYCPEWFEGVGYDPSAGDGRMLREIIRRGNTNAHFVNEVREEEEAALRELPGAHVTIGDYLTVTNLPVVDFTVTNPPFSRAQAMVDRALTHTKGVVSIMQSTQWQGSRKRASWFRSAGLSHVLHLSRRPQWEVDAGAEPPKMFWNFAWFVFQPNYVGPVITDWID